MPWQEDTSAGLAAPTVGLVCAPWWKTPVDAAWSRGDMLLTLILLKVGAPTSYYSDSSQDDQNVLYSRN